MRNATRSAFALFASWLLSACASIFEFPPTIPESQINAGRTQAISVSPTDSDHIVIVTDFGGLWKTTTGGRNWSHLDSLMAVFAMDVQFGADGRTLVATLSGDGRRENRGGIWLSRDAGATWVRPVNGAIPLARVLPAGAGAWGISVAPDQPRRWFVGTDFGVARSEDNGETWEHRVVDAELPPIADGRQGAARSVLAFPGGRVLAMLSTGIYRSDDNGYRWRKILDGDFSFLEGIGFNKMDRSPHGPLAFILKDYQTLLAFELDTETLTTLTLPSGVDANTRGPFVRVARVIPATNIGSRLEAGLARRAAREGFTIWVGQGFNTLFATVSSARVLPTLVSTDWSRIGRAEGVHDDTGDLGLNADARPVLLGTDGGVFKPADATLARWESAARRGSQMNSLQITDLAGVNIEGPDTSQTFLYFGTQDNSIWASTDGGVTWPAFDYPEGFALEVRPHVRSAAQATIAYCKIGGGDPFILASADFSDRRPVPTASVDGVTLSDMGLSYLLTAGDALSGANNAWLRMRFPPDARPEVYLSLDNAETWRKQFVLAFRPAGHLV